MPRYNTTSAESEPEWRTIYWSKAQSYIIQLCVGASTKEGTKSFTDLSIITPEDNCRKQLSFCYLIRFIITMNLRQYSTQSINATNVRLARNTRLCFLYRQYTNLCIIFLYYFLTGYCIESKQIRRQSKTDCLQSCCQRRSKCQGLWRKYLRLNYVLAIHKCVFLFDLYADYQRVKRRSN